MSTNTLAAIHLESGKTKLIPPDKRPQGAVRSHHGKLLYLTNSEGNSITTADVAKQENIGRIPTGAGPNRIALTPDGRTPVYSFRRGSTGTGRYGISVTTVGMAGLCFDSSRSPGRSGWS